MRHQKVGTSKCLYARVRQQFKIHDFQTLKYKDIEGRVRIEQTYFFFK